MLLVDSDIDSVVFVCYFFEVVFSVLEKGTEPVLSYFIEVFPVFDFWMTS